MSSVVARAKDHFPSTKLPFVNFVSPPSPKQTPPLLNAKPIPQTPYRNVVPYPQWHFRSYTYSHNSTNSTGLTGTK